MFPPEEQRPITKAYVLLSGGMDSTTVLYMMIDMLGKNNVKAYSIDYGQVHMQEISAAQRVCAHTNVWHSILHLSRQPASPLTSKKLNQTIPDKTYDELSHGVSPSYHHFRNGQLLSLLTAYASADLNPDHQGLVCAGQHAEDAQNWAYPDCTPEFLGAMANAIHVGTYYKIRLHTPLMWAMKHEIVTIGHKLGVPWHLTYSCYRGGEQHCGACPTCHARQGAFRAAKVSDPTIYSSAYAE
jgi:7-cyano-7-deazaguanine synthase